MTNFLVHTIETAPERSKPALRQLQSAFGMIPNIAGVMATSPVLINSLVGLFGNVLPSGAGCAANNAPKNSMCFCNVNGTQVQGHIQ